MASLIFLDLVPSIVALGLILLIPPEGLKLFHIVTTALTRIAARPQLSLWLVAGFAVLCCIGLSLIFGVPEPRVHDEFSYLLAADTFLNGRVTNLTHPLWRHFETFHVIHQPTYASKFFPAQGLVLAGGRLIGGHPIIGVWVSVAALCAGICWMLRAYVPRRWALLGAILALLQVRLAVHVGAGGIWGYWSQSYWGGAVAAFGGTLLFGALPRIMRKPTVGNSLLFALGLVILANSRPFEGLVASILPVTRLVIWLARDNRFPRGLRLSQVGLPIMILVVAAAGMIGYYNFRVTGAPLQFPYQVHKDTYMESPLFAFQDLATPKAYNHERIRNFHTGWELYPYLAQQTVLGVLAETGKKLATLWGFYIGPMLSLPLLMVLPFLWRNQRMRLPLAVCALLVIAFMPLNWVLSHYAAPITCLTSLLGVQALRQVRLWSWQGRAVGRRIAYGIPVAFIASTMVTTAIQLKYFSDWNTERARLVGELNQKPGRHLVLVRYNTAGNDKQESHVEWVVNEADIDNAKVVWAREMNAEQNQKLLQYFKGREFWLLDYREAQPSRFVKVTQSYPRSTD